MKGLALKAGKEISLAYWGTLFCLLAVLLLASGAWAEGEASSTVAFVKLSYELDENNNVVSENLDIYAAGPDLTDQVNLTNHPAADRGPDWSPDRERIVFFRMGEEHENQEIYLMNADGSNQQRLTFAEPADPPVHNMSPFWSPDGERIAFSHGPMGARQIYIMNADGSDPTPVPNQPGGDSWWPRWSPDGTRLAFANRPDADTPFDIYHMSIDGSELIRLTEDALMDNMPAWSPDGESIAWMSMQSGYNEIHVISPDGQNRRTLITKPDEVDVDMWFAGYPNWSRDGGQLYFSRGDPETGFLEEVEVLYEIFVANADGTDIRRLTHSPLEEENYWATP